MNVPRSPNVMSSTLSNVLITLRVSQIRYVGRRLGKNNRMAAAEWIFEESLAGMLGAVSYSISMSSMGCKLQEGYWSGRGVNCLFRAGEMERRWWSENKRQRRQTSCPLPPLFSCWSISKIVSIPSCTDSEHETAPAGR